MTQAVSAIVRYPEAWCCETQPAQAVSTWRLLRSLQRLLRFHEVSQRMVSEKRQLSFRHDGAIILCCLPSVAYCLSSPVNTTSKCQPETSPASPTTSIDQRVHGQRVKAAYTGYRHKFITLGLDLQTVLLRPNQLACNNDSFGGVTVSRPKPQLRVLPHYPRTPT